jgi:hypothetical protein
MSILYHIVNSAATANQERIKLTLDDTVAMLKQRF